MSEAHRMFINREEAGRMLGRKITDELPRCMSSQDEQIVIGLGRGGIAVAASLAQKLNSPLSVFVVESIADIKEPEKAIAAVSANGPVVYNEKTQCCQGEHSYLGHQVRELSQKTADCQKRWLATAGVNTQPDFNGKRVIIVDEVVVSDLISQAAAMNIRKLGASEIIFAAPIILKQLEDKLKTTYDAVVSLVTPEKLNSIDEFYDEFHEIGDAEVVETLNRTAEVQRVSVLE